MNLQKHLYNFIIKNSSDKITLEDVEKSLKSDADIPKRILEDYLEESQYLFTLSAENSTVKSYTSRSNIFNKAEFKITPTATEIKKGILFSGHRFIPFYSQDLFPTESFKIKTESGTMIATKNISFKLEDLYAYYSMLGAEGIIDDLTADCEGNVEIIGNPSQKVNISVFDFSSFYGKFSFTAGMSLKFTVEDWIKGKFSVSIDKDIVTEEEKHKWHEALEEGLFKVFDEFGPSLEIPEQLSLGYYYSPSFVLKSPPCPIDIFVKTNEKIQVKFFENNTILWHSEEQHISSEPANDMVSISQGTIESLDAILEELELLISSVEIEAFIRDSLLSDSDTKAGILNKILPESVFNFKDKAQETAFLNHLEELWEDIATDYNREIDSKTAPFRKEILDNLEILYSWHNESKELIKEKTAFIESEIAALHSNIHKVREILDLLNHNQNEIDSDDAEQLNDVIFNHLKNLNDLIDRINSLIN